MSSFKDHFSAASADYAAHRPRYPDALVDWLASLCGVPRVAWEAGCGSGQLTTALADRLERVEATDASAAQTANATPHARARYRVAPAEACGLADGSAGLVVVAQAAHWFELPRFYAEATRVAPGGALALVAYGRLTLDPAVDAVVNAFHDDRLAPYWPPERAHILDGYASLPFPFPRIDAPAFTMTARWSVDALLGYVDTWSAVRALERAGRPDEMRAFADAVRAAWTGGPREVRWPLVVCAGRLPRR